MSSLRAAVLEQLHTRLDPPIPADLVVVAERAVRLCATGNGDRPIEIEAGPCMPAAGIVEALGLEDLIP